MEAPAGQNRIDADGDVALPRETLRGNGERFRVIAEAIPGMVWTCTPDGRCDYVSRRWPEYTGADFQEALSDGASSFVHADDMARVQEVWKRAVEAGRGDETQLRLRRRDGVYRWHLVRGVPECDAHGQITHWVGVAIDIEELAATHATLTHAKEELERTVADRTHQLQEVVEQLEAFAYSIAHDMRAPLRTMHQYAQIVARDYAARVPDDVRIYLNKIMAAAERLDTLIREVLVYTKVSQGQLEMQPTNLERLLSEILIMHPQLNPPQAEVHARLPLHAVIADETALTQALSNLLTNAVKFVPSDRKAKCTIWTEQVGEQVRIYIQDNGIGIPTRDQKRIFKMFERLQPESKYEGTGIGLTIVRRAVERMDGNLGIESADGKGSKFWIELKIAEL
ncbi:MAG: ATP-binding protein [Verrucomicrobia subdivision 3 bacterium]|nr:ATP-binding protein [Limisphaerales bacterium]